MKREARETAVNRLRTEILDHVRSRAGDPPGLFTLTVPTGGGKTLASLGFALNHAKAHGRERIIYAIPFTAVIDQTAAIFREVLGDDVILEHHSAIEDEDRPTAPREADSTKADRDKLKLAMEDWAAPVVVTTNVQLFESLFAARTSAAAGCTTSPAVSSYWTPSSNFAVRCSRLARRHSTSLARNYRCTIVLCTATQPALDAESFFSANIPADSLIRRTFCSPVASWHPIPPGSRSSSSASGLRTVAKWMMRRLLPRWRAPIRRSSSSTHANTPSRSTARRMQPVSTVSCI